LSRPEPHPVRVAKLGNLGIQAHPLLLEFAATVLLGITKIPKDSPRVFFARRVQCLTMSEQNVLAVKSASLQMEKQSLQNAPTVLLGITKKPSNKPRANSAKNLQCLKMQKQNASLVTLASRQMENELSQNVRIVCQGCIKIRNNKNNAKRVNKEKHPTISKHFVYFQNGRLHFPAPPRYST